MTRFNRRRDFSTAELVGFGLGIIVIGIGVIALQAWLLGVVLGWFGVTLEFWKNVVIILLLNSVFGGAKASSS